MIPKSGSWQDSFAAQTQKGSPLEELQPGDHPLGSRVPTAAEPPCLTKSLIPAQGGCGAGEWQEQGHGKPTASSGEKGTVSGRSEPGLACRSQARHPVSLWLTIPQQPRNRCTVTFSGETENATAGTGSYTSWEEPGEWSPSQRCGECRDPFDVLCIRRRASAAAAAELCVRGPGAWQPVRAIPVDRQTPLVGGGGALLICAPCQGLGHAEDLEDGPDKLLLAGEEETGKRFLHTFCFH